MILRFAFRNFKTQALARVLPCHFNPYSNFTFCTTPTHTETLLKNLNNIKQSKGSNSIEYIKSLSLLAEHYTNTNNLQEAEKTYLELVDITQDVFEGDLQFYFSFLFKLLEILYQKEDFAKAIEILFKVQKLSEKNSLGYCKTLTNLSMCYEKLGKREEAKNCLLLNV